MGGWVKLKTQFFLKKIQNKKKERSLILQVKKGGESVG